VPSPDTYSGTDEVVTLPVNVCADTKFSRKTRIILAAAGVILGLAACVLQAQATSVPTPSQNGDAARPAATTSGDAATANSTGNQPDAAATNIDVKLPHLRDRRSAAKLYIAASKLFMDEHFEEAQQDYDQAAALDPANTNYRLAADVARSHAVTALIQSAAKARIGGDAGAARAALARALELDPKSAEATQHLYELGDDAASELPRPLYEEAAGTVSDSVPLAPAAGLKSFHLRNGQRQIIQQAFKAYGIEATADDSVQSTMVRFDIDSVNFDQATRALELVTNSFHVPIDAHRVLVARDTPTNRRDFTRQEMETIYLSGMKPEEMTEVTNLAKQVFNLQQVQLVPSKSSITIRAPKESLQAFNSTIQTLIDGHSQVMLDVRLIQIAHVRGRDTGVTPPQTFSAFNVYAEEQSILNANKDLVAQIISSGLAAPGDTLAILGILLSSGQVSSSLFSNGIALFGGGLTQSALAPGGATAHFNLNSSDSRELDEIRLHLGDGEPGTIKEGERYPIQTSSFSSLSASIPNIPGLNGAGASGDLASILGSLGGAVPSVPQVEYQDLGLTLKTTANVMRNNDVALTVDLKITALSGGSINGNPILNNRAYSGVVTIKEGETVVVASELDKSESRNISGTPGLSEIPGLNNLTEKDVQKNYATLLIVITPHVIRGTQAGGRTPMMRVERGTQAR
jgi:tetratricopeptide (TPR) repeat protein